MNIRKIAYSLAVVMLSYDVQQEKKKLSNEAKEQLLNLKIKGLLVDYQLRREEMLRSFDNLNRVTQVFLAGTFLLIAYAIFSAENLLFLAIPVILFVLFHFLLFCDQLIYTHEGRCIEIERKIEELLKDDRILCYEREYGRLSRKWIGLKIYRAYYTIIGAMGIAYIIFSVLALYVNYELLGSEITCVVTIIVIILFLISFFNGLNVSKLKEKCM